MRRAKHNILRKSRTGNKNSGLRTGKKEKPAITDFSGEGGGDIRPEKKSNTPKFGYNKKSLQQKKPRKVWDGKS